MEEKLILVVDDQKSNIDIIMGILEDSYEMAVALDGETALEIASEDKPDLILLDLIMPDMDGYEVIKNLKNDPESKKIPVIFLSGETGEEEQKKALDLGAKDFLQKPVSPTLLLESIKKFMK